MKKLHIVHLYPNEMNTYGDRGNVLTLTRRAAWHGLEPIVHHHHPGKPFPTEAHIIFGGGGQDSEQSDIQTDILRIGDRLHAYAKQGVPMLTICGTYQLFGHRFITHDEQSITGIGLFDLETHATTKRLIGNLAAQTEEFGILYGFENHSGQTFLGKGQAPLGTVIRGHGNNADSGLEGARINNVLGCYMHGPILPTNPTLSDWLITTGARLEDSTFTPHTIDDQYATMARTLAKHRKY
jgi:CobQ-like glutamine amidotransferase family enzyme